MCRMVIDNNDIPKQDYMVLCSTVTYNQAPYITDTMNGFCMQQTSFSYACYIIDDASTDGEQDVIKAYLDEHFQMDKAEQYELELANVIVAKHNTNPNCTFAVYLLKRNLWKEPDLKRPLGRPWTQRCKYIAICEGDDYWTDPHKLQKQVDFLEKNEDYVLVHTDKYVEFGADGVRCTCPHSSEGENVNSLLKANTIATCTTLYRVATYHKISELLSSICRNNHLPMGDYPLWLLLAEYGKIAFLPDFTAVYRVLSESASHTRNVKKAVAFDDGTIRCKIIFYQRYIANNGYSNKLNLEFNEMIFHMRKRMLLDYGWAARGQIIPLLKLLPHWQYICMQSIKRKLNQRK